MAAERRRRRSDPVEEYEDYEVQLHSDEGSGSPRNTRASRRSGGSSRRSATSSRRSAGSRRSGGSRESRASRSVVSSRSQRSQPGDPPADPASEESEQSASSEVDKPPLVVPQEDMVDFLYYHRLYDRGDPFENLTALWLETGSKQFTEDLDQPPETSDAKAQTVPTRSPEEELAEEQMGFMREAAAGHLLWMRGRDLRAELVDQVQKKIQEHPSFFSQTSLTISTPHSYSRRSSVTSADPGFHWFRAPRLPRSAAEAPGSRGRGAKVAWCWRCDFVIEALHAAVGLGMELPAVDAHEAKRALRNNPEVATRLRHHVAAISTDGRCELWSPSFLQVLSVLRERWEFGDEVRLAENEVIHKHPEVMRFFMRGRKSLRQEVKKAQVPAALLKARGPAPEVQVPDRLPTRMAYTMSRRMSSGSLGLGSPTESRETSQWKGTRNKATSLTAAARTLFHRGEKPAKKSPMAKKQVSFGP